MLIMYTIINHNMRLNILKTLHKFKYYWVFVKLDYINDHKLLYHINE